MTVKELNQLKSVDIRMVDKNNLMDIKEVVVSPQLEKRKRILQFLEKARNPYCFLINGVAVKFVFSENHCGLEERLKGYLKGKIN